MERSIRTDDSDDGCWLSTRWRHLWSNGGLDGRSIDHTQSLHRPWSSRHSIDDLSSSSARRSTTGRRPAESQSGTVIQFLRTCLLPGIILVGNHNIYACYGCPLSFSRLIRKILSMYCSELR